MEENTTEHILSRMTIIINVPGHLFTASIQPSSRPAIEKIIANICFSGANSIKRAEARLSGMKKELFRTGLFHINDCDISKFTQLLLGVIFL